jgi:biopolymer transport protein ExbB/TolQ
MTAKSTLDAELGNDVQVIREILFGKQAQFFHDQIEALKKELASLRQENAQLRRDLEAEAQRRQQAFEELTRRTETQFNETQQGNDRQVEAIREKHNQDMSRLVSALAAALASYQAAES